MSSQPNSTDQALSALGHAVSGSAGAAISTASLYPLDLVTTRLKAQHQWQNQAEQYDGVIAAFRNILQHEGGVGALYKGLGPDVAKSALDNFLFFGIYSYLRPRHGQTGVIRELGLGAVAGACARFLTTPISNVVARKQTSASGEERLAQILAAMYRDSGLTGLWSGYSATLVLSLNPSLTFFINRRLAERIIPALEDEDVPVAWIAFLAAASSKAMATAITYPFQTGKTRLQISSSFDANDVKEKGQEQDNRLWKAWLRRLLALLDRSIFGVVLRIMRHEGPRALYAGIQGELLRSFFSHGITMLTKGVMHRLVIRIWLRWLLPLAQRWRSLIL